MNHFNFQIKNNYCFLQMHFKITNSKKTKNKYLRNINAYTIVLISLYIY